MQLYIQTELSSQGSISLSISSHAYIHVHNVCMTYIYVNFWLNVINMQRRFYYKQGWGVSGIICFSAFSTLLPLLVSALWHIFISIRMYIAQVKKCKLKTINFLPGAQANGPEKEDAHPTWAEMQTLTMCRIHLSLLSQSPLVTTDNHDLIGISWLPHDCSMYVGASLCQINKHTSCLQIQEGFV